MIASLATMETDDPDAQLMQALLNQFLPMLDSLDTLKEGVAQLNDGPVSYTHLDVYKRQCPNRPRINATISR